MSRRRSQASPIQYGANLRRRPTEAAPPFDIAITDGRQLRERLFEPLLEERSHGVDLKPDAIEAPRRHEARRSCSGTTSSRREHCGCGLHKAATIQSQSPANLTSTGLVMSPAETPRSRNSRTDFRPRAP